MRVKACDKVVLREEIGATGTSGHRLLAVDEIALLRGHDYMTVVLDVETGRVVWRGMDRTSATLGAYVELISGKERATVEAVALDTWHAYLQAVWA